MDLAIGKGPPNTVKMTGEVRDDALCLFWLHLDLGSLNDNLRKPI